jgi:hypothetical protein
MYSDDTFAAKERTTVIENIARQTRMLLVTIAGSATAIHIAALVLGSSW